MSIEHHGPHLLKHMFEDLPPLSNKNPIIAGLLGFFFGGIGLGLYFKSWKDAVYTVLAFVILTVMFPVFGGEVAGMCFAATWGVVRAMNS